MKFLDVNGVTYLWEKIKTYVEDYVDTHAGGEADGNDYPDFATLSNTSGKKIQLTLGMAGTGGKPNIKSNELDLSPLIPTVTDTNYYPTALSLSTSNNKLTATLSSNNGMPSVTGEVALPSSGISQDTADGRYVKKSGDTMTGTLTVGSALYINPSTGSAQNIVFQNTSGGLTITCNGNSPTVTSNASIYAPSFYESSDLRLKENIGNIGQDDIDKVNNIEFKRFNFKGQDESEVKYGVIAQEVEKAGLDNLIGTNQDGLKAVDYISLLILKIEALEKEVKELKSGRK